jgi:hypothetical protein
MDNKAKDVGNQVNLSPYHKTAGDSTKGMCLQAIVEFRAYLRHVSIHIRPQYRMENIVFSDIAGRGDPDDRIVDE